jgi:hypothetical protein
MPPLRGSLWREYVCYRGLSFILTMNDGLHQTVKICRPSGALVYSDFEPWAVPRAINMPPLRGSTSLLILNPGLKICRPSGALVHSDYEPWASPRAGICRSFGASLSDYERLAARIFKTLTLLDSISEMYLTYR